MPLKCWIQAEQPQPQKKYVLDPIQRPPGRPQMTASMKRCWNQPERPRNRVAPKSASRNSIVASVHPNMSTVTREKSAIGMTHSNSPRSTRIFTVSGYCFSFFLSTNFVLFFCRVFVVFVFGKLRCTEFFVFLLFLLLDWMNLQVCHLHLPVAIAKQLFGLMQATVIGVESQRWHYQQHHCVVLNRLSTFSVN